jgi:hypothetical protein
MLPIFSNLRLGLRDGLFSSGIFVNFTFYEAFSSLSCLPLLHSNLIFTDFVTVMNNETSNYGVSLYMIRKPVPSLSLSVPNGHARRTGA